jgi:hypothetical protein
MDDFGLFGEAIDLYPTVDGASAGKMPGQDDIFFTAISGEVGKIDIRLCHYSRGRLWDRWSGRRDALRFRTRGNSRRYRYVSGRR